jgi:type VI secretion system (T6SS) baseplate-like injector VgrG
MGPYGTGPQFTEEFVHREQRGDPSGGPPDGVGGIRRYWGKYPGIVVQPVDPEFRCRMLVSVPDVFGPNVTSWALPSLPFAGVSLGMYVIPAIGANVWVEFLHGNPEIPIWTGFWFGSLATIPKTPLTAVPGAPHLSVASLVDHAIVVSDTPVLPFLPKGGILMKSGTGTYVAVDVTGVRIFGYSVQVNGTPDGVNPLTAALTIV